MVKPATQAGAPFVSAFDAAQRALRVWAFASAPSLLSGCSMACSHGRLTAAARRDVARELPLIAMKREGSAVAPAIETRYSVAQPEGLEPGPQDAPASDGACLLQCLYMADRCDRNCAGCAVTASAAREGAPLAGKGAAPASGAQCGECPDGNHGESNSTEGKSS